MGSLSPLATPMFVADSEETHLGQQKMNLSSVQLFFFVEITVT